MVSCDELVSNFPSFEIEIEIENVFDCYYLTIVLIVAKTAVMMVFWCSGYNEDSIVVTI